MIHLPYTPSRHSPSASLPHPHTTHHTPHATRILRRAELNPETLAATLQLQVESSNALYGIYWKQDGKTARAAKTFSTPKYGAYLEAAQKKFSFVDISTQSTVDIDGNSPVAQAIRTRSKLFVADASAMDDERASVAREYFIGSIACAACALQMRSTAPAHTRAPKLRRCARWSCDV